jgi:hypothetical protein
MKMKKKPKQESVTFGVRCSSPEVKNELKKLLKKGAAESGVTISNYIMELLRDKNT